MTNVWHQGIAGPAGNCSMTAAESGSGSILSPSYDGRDYGELLVYVSVSGGRVWVEVQLRGMWT